MSPNQNFIIPIILQPYIRNSWYFKLILLYLTEFIVWNVSGVQRYVKKDVGIRKSEFGEFVAKTQFVYLRFLKSPWKVFFFEYLRTNPIPTNTTANLSLLSVYVYHLQLVYSNLSIHLSYVSLSVICLPLFICLSVYMSICLSVYLFVYLSIYLRQCLFMAKEKDAKKGEPSF